MSEKLKTRQCCNPACRVRFSAARADGYCAPCRQKVNQQRPRRLATRAAAERRKFPGLDMDAIYRNPRFRRLAK